MIVGLRGNVIIREVFLSVERHLFSFHLPFLDVHLVAYKHDGNHIAHPNKIAMPVGHVLVCDSRRDVEHNDSALSLDAEPN